MSSWRPSLRIARRAILQSRWRSLLICIIVAVPVAGVAMADIAARTLDDRERQATRQLGSADAVAQVAPTPDAAPGAPLDVEAIDEEGLTRALPRGSRVVRDGQDARLTTVAKGRRGMQVDVIPADVDEPLDEHRVRLRDGKAPTEDRAMLVTPGLADRLDIQIGDRIEVGDVDDVRVSGIARDPFCHGCDHVFAPRGSALADANRGADRAGGAPDIFARYLIDLPDGADVTKLRLRLLADGIQLVDRDMIIGDGGGSGPVPETVTVEVVQAAAAVALIAGLGLLEIVLLAGAAFAVGVRRQTRDIGLVAVGGGSPRDVRRVVLAQGLVLGVIGAALGIAVGIAAMYVGHAGWERLAGEDIDGWVLRPWELGGAMLIGIASGFAAAFIPAIGAARMRVVDALAGRWTRRSARRPRAPWLGGALIAVGGGVALLGDHAMADGFAEYRRSLARFADTGAYVSPPSSAGAVLAVVGGAAIVAAGLVILMPFLISSLARIGRHLSLSPRLAVRDASRNRHRSGPATTAIAIAVAGTVMIAFVIAGSQARDEATYVPAAPDGTVIVNGFGDDGLSRSSVEAAATLVRLRAPIGDALPGSRPAQLRVPVVPCTDALALGSGCVPGEPVQSYVSAATACPEGCAGFGGVAVVDDADDLETLAGVTIPADARRAFERGSAIVLDRQLIDRGQIRIGPIGEDGDAADPIAADPAVPTAAPALLPPGSPDVVAPEAASNGERATLVPAVYLERAVMYGTLPSVLLPESALEPMDATAQLSSLVVPADDARTQEQLDTATRVAARAGGSLDVEDGPEPIDERVYILVAAIAGFVTLIGVAITVALSAAEGRADLATMAAVGAPPRRRRTIVAAQALLVAALGVVFGIAFGTFFAWVSRSTFGAPEFAVPWSTLGLMLVAVPVLAVLVAYLCTPSRFPLQRRVED